MIRPALWNFGSFVVVALAGLVLNLAIGRFYGPATLGDFNLAVAVYIVASQIATQGVQFAMLRAISLAAHEQADRETIGVIASSGLAVVLASAILVALATLALTPLLGWIYDSAGLRTGIVILACGLPFFALNKALLATLNGLGRLEQYAIGQALRYIFIIGWLLAWLGFGWPGDTLAATLTLSEVLLALVLTTMVRRRARLSPTLIDRGQARELHRFGLRAMWSGAVSEVNTRIDILVLGLFASQSTVGVYSIVALIFEGLMQLPFVLRTVVNARLSVLATPERQDELRVELRPVKLLAFGAMAACAIIAIAIYPVFVHVVLADARFEAAWLPLGILVVGLAIASPYLPLDFLLSQGGAPWAQSQLRFWVAGANLLLNLALVPFLGMTGAALATAIATVFGSVMTAVLARRVLGVRV